MRTDHPSSAIAKSRTPIMLGTVAVLQVLDWHSTLSASPNRHETNRLLNWIAQWISFACEVSIIKATFIAVLAGGYFYWRQHKGVYEFEFALCLGVLIAVYSCIVINNYAT